jgi:hypothetical protein
MWQNVAFFMSRLAWAVVGRSSATPLGGHRWCSRPWRRSRGTGRAGSSRRQAVKVQLVATADGGSRSELYHTGCSDRRKVRVANAGAGLATARPPGQ